MSHYHIRRQEREIHDQPELTRLLDQGRYMILALCRDNEPYAVTLSYAYDPGQSACYFHCATSGHKLDFLAENPRVCGTVIEDRGYQYGECSHRYATLVVRGTMSIVEDLDAKKHAVALLLRHLEQDPAPIAKRNLPNDAAYNQIVVLKLSLTDITGKQGG